MISILCEIQEIEIIEKKIKKIICNSISQIEIMLF